MACGCQNSMGVFFIFFLFALFWEHFTSLLGIHCWRHDFDIMRFIRIIPLPVDFPIIIIIMFCLSLRMLSQCLAFSPPISCPLMPSWRWWTASSSTATAASSPPPSRHLPQRGTRFRWKVRSFVKEVTGLSAAAGLVRLEIDWFVICRDWPVHDLHFELLLA